METRTPEERRFLIAMKFATDMAALQENDDEQGLFDRLARLVAEVETDSEQRGAAKRQAEIVRMLKGEVDTGYSGPPVWDGCKPSDIINALIRKIEEGQSCDSKN